MSEERKKVLEMLAAGKISAEEAEKLLDKLAGAPSNQSAGAESSPGTAALPTGRPKYLRVVVDHPGREQVNMRVPLSLVGSGTRLFAVMPQRINARLAEYGIDAGVFSSMKIEDLDAALRELNVDVDRADGKKVRIYCE
jgi:hypothetical protein